MKRIFSALLCALLLVSLAACGRENDAPDAGDAEPPTAGEASLSALRQELHDAGALLGVAYLGSSEGASEIDLSAVLDGTDYAARYPFLADIPAEHFVGTEGWDVYCLVPADEDAALSVLALSNDTGETVPGEELYRGAGEPILLLANVSDIMTNTRVTLTAADGSALDYEPFLSLKDGRLAADSPLLLDFSFYPDWMENEE